MGQKHWAANNVFTLPSVILTEYGNLIFLFFQREITQVSFTFFLLKLTYLLIPCNCDRLMIILSRSSI